MEARLAPDSRSERGLPRGIFPNSNTFAMRRGGGGGGGSAQFQSCSTVTGRSRRRRPGASDGEERLPSSPSGDDFPPFSANKGGSIDGSKIFLLTFDLAFQIQEELRKLDAGGEVPLGIAPGAVSRLQYASRLLRRLLRQWAIPPARQFNRLPSRARVVMCAGLYGVWQYSRGVHAGVAQPPKGLPPMTGCQVINHTPAGYALRQIDPNPTALRIGDLIALRVEGKTGVQVAMVRWFRNTLKGSGLEFGCELLTDSPEAAAAIPEGAADEQFVPVVVLPEDGSASGPEPAPSQLLVPDKTFQVEQGITLRRGGETGLAVLLKLVEHGPGFELYEFTYRVVAPRVARAFAMPPRDGIASRSRRSWRWRSPNCSGRRCWRRCARADRGSR